MTNLHIAGHASYDRETAKACFSHVIHTGSTMHEDSWKQVLCASAATHYFVWDDQRDDAYYHMNQAADIIWC